MKRESCRIGAAVAVLAMVLLNFTCNVRSPASRDFMKGVAFTGYSRDAYTGDVPRRSVDALKVTNADWASILATGYQATIHSTSIDFSGPGTPSDASLAALIGYARSIGLRVMLKPHVDLFDDDLHYRGEIGPGFTAADWSAWFSSYRTFILHYAAMAARTECELFCVGCELGSTAFREADWRGIIAEIRTVYNGPLIYADNLVEGAPDAIHWWDALDYIGEDAYPTLSDKVEPSVSDLLAGWGPFLKKLEALSKRWNKPLVLTEIGYRSVRGGTINPWDWQRQGPVDLTVQENAYEAAFRAISGKSWLAGIFWWQWMPDQDHGGPTDTGYSPHGKPAESVLRAWFGRAL
jgi:hypothetical protein